MRILTAIVFLCLTATLNAQTPDGQDGFVVRAIVIDGDTVITMNLPEHEVVGRHIFRNRREEQRHHRLVHNVRRVYPFAKLAGEIYRDLMTVLANEPCERRQNQLMRQAERDIRRQFERDLRNLTVSQGQILVLLLDRETSHSAFNLVRDLRNAFLANVFQGVGRIFGYNLRVRYDPDGRHADIESIVRAIERGEIEPFPLPGR
ncbi:MAG: DUF4294 domain-containing protein [Bacteroidales bacterium]|nr:DUF4294 domain-containing protein [Bacteroidales bacterium]